MEILVPSEFHEKSGTGSEGCVQQVGELPANIARNDMPWEPVEWRLPSQMNCRKVWDRALTAMPGRAEIFLPFIARADVPWSDVWRGSRRSIDTDRCHRAKRYALGARRMAIAEPDELQESVGPGADGCAWQVGVPPANHRASQSASDVAVWHIRSRGEFHERTHTSNQCNPWQSLFDQSQYAEPAFRTLQNLIFLKIVVCIMARNFAAYTFSRPLVILPRH